MEKYAEDIRVLFRYLSLRKFKKMRNITTSALITNKMEVKENDTDTELSLSIIRELMMDKSPFAYEYNTYRTLQIDKRGGKTIEVDMIKITRLYGNLARDMSEMREPFLKYTQDEMKQKLSKLVIEGVDGTFGIIVRSLISVEAGKIPNVLLVLDSESYEPLFPPQQLPTSLEDIQKKPVILPPLKTPTYNRKNLKRILNDSKSNIPNLIPEKQIHPIGYGYSNTPKRKKLFTGIDTGGGKLKVGTIEESLEDVYELDKEGKHREYLSAVANKIHNQFFEDQLETTEHIVKPIEREVCIPKTAPVVNLSYMEAQPLPIREKKPLPKITIQEDIVIPNKIVEINSDEIINPPPFKLKTNISTPEPISIPNSTTNQTITTPSLSDVPKIQSDSLFTSTLESSEVPIINASKLLNTGEISTDDNGEHTSLNHPETDKPQIIDESDGINECENMSLNETEKDEQNECECTLTNEEEKDEKGDDLECEYISTKEGEKKLEEIECGAILEWDYDIDLHNDENNNDLENSNTENVTLHKQVNDIIKDIKRGEFENLSDSDINLVNEEYTPIKRRNKTLRNDRPLSCVWGNNLEDDLSKSLLNKHPSLPSLLNKSYYSLTSIDKNNIALYNDEEMQATSPINSTEDRIIFSLDYNTDNKDYEFMIIKDEEYVGKGGDVNDGEEEEESNLKIYEQNISLYNLYKKKLKIQQKISFVNLTKQLLDNLFFDILKRNNINDDDFKNVFNVNRTIEEIVYEEENNFYTRNEELIKEIEENGFNIKIQLFNSSQSRNEFIKSINENIINLWDTHASYNNVYEHEKEYINTIESYIDMLQIKNKKIKQSFSERIDRIYKEQKNEIEEHYSKMVEKGKYILDFLVKNKTDIGKQNELLINYIKQEFEILSRYIPNYNVAVISSLNMYNYNQLKETALGINDTFLALMEDPNFIPSDIFPYIKGEYILHLTHRRNIIKYILDNYNENSQITKEVKIKLQEIYSNLMQYLQFERENRNLYLNDMIERESKKLQQIYEENDNILQKVVRG